MRGADSFREGYDGLTMIKNRFKDDYSWTARLNGRGRVVDDICYTGVYYILPLTQEQKKKSNYCNMGFGLLLLAIQLAAGMVNQDSSRTFYIMFPYLFTLLPVFYFLLGAFSYWSDPVKQQKAQYETGLARMKRSAMGSMVMNGISVILDIVYMILHRGNMQTLRELIYLGLLIAYIVAAFCYGRYYDKTYGALTTQQSGNRLE